MSARPLDASVALLAHGYDERSTQANIQHIENPRRGSCVLVPSGDRDAPDATGAASVKYETHWCVDVASKMGIMPVATSSSRRIDPA